MHNVDIARRLEEVAELLEEQRANPFRVEAYRRMALRIRQLPKSLCDIWKEQGDEGLREVTGAGERLSTTLRTLVTTGRLPMLGRLRGESDSIALLKSVSGIGPALAERLHDDLGIETLEQLESAAHDGRLANFAGIGKKKLAGVMDSMAGRLGRVRERPHDHEDEPSVAELLDVDHEYREKAEAGALPTIAPRRFNPGRESWLPILHTHRGTRNYTALYSNTARAHELGRTRDWVVLYYDGGFDEGQATVISSQYGALRGERIVRGREQECAELYGRRSQDASSTEGEHARLLPPLQSRSAGR